MNKTVGIIISTLMWCLIAAYIVLAGSYSRERRALITIRDVRIEIADSARSGVVGTRMIERLLAGADLNPVGQPAGSVDTRAIEDLISANPEVGRADVWTNLEGVLTVRVEGRTPLMRVRSSNGYRFWLTRDGYILPDRGDFTAYVPVVTGDIPFPFGASRSGSYTAIQKDNYDDFLDRFTAIENERLTLSVDRAATLAAIRTERSSGPRRWWNDARKKAFNDARTERIAELRKEETRLGEALDRLAENKRSLEEKEKKSYESFRFLSKLANFVEFIEHDDFWAAQIVQINVRGSGASNGEGGGGTSSAAVWREPELELVPRAGDHTVLLGELDGAEKERLEGLYLFYSKGLWHEGWGKYGNIDIRYKDQIVCTK